MKRAGWGLALLILLAQSGDADAQAPTNPGAQRAAQLAREQAQEQIDDASLGTSCQDVATLEARASSVLGPQTAQAYRDAAARHRARAIQAFKLSAKTFGSKQWTRETFAQADPPDAGVPAAIAAERSEVERLRCHDAALADEMAASLDKIEALVNSMIADEVKCRATPACIQPRQEARIAQGICAAIADKRDALAAIARERSNPGGVVDLQQLHVLGEEIQNDDDVIASGKKQYTAIRHHVFADNLCK